MQQHQLQIQQWYLHIEKFQGEISETAEYQLLD